jgi:hypothetical protein
LNTVLLKHSRRFGFGIATAPNNFACNIIHAKREEEKRERNKKEGRKEERKRKRKRRNKEKKK